MKRKTQEIRTFMLELIDRGVSHDLTRAVVATYGITRQAAQKNARALVEEGLIKAEGEGRNRKYKLAVLSDARIKIHLDAQTNEDTIWNESVSPHLKDVKENVRDIAHHGFTEIFNNVIDHSESKNAEVAILRDALSIKIQVADKGIGIWKKIMQRHPTITDPRHALFELSKGKLTTDPQKHTGEGIFFTSRMVDRFFLASDRLSFCRFLDGAEWFFDVKEDNYGPGTWVSLNIRLNSDKTVQGIFDQYSSGDDDFSFSKTVISVELAKYEGDNLVSRSQAKRLMARLEKFKEIWLDFNRITYIGPAFADQVFRIFVREHPGIDLHSVNEAPQVKRMIERAVHGALESEEEQPQLPLST